MNSQVSIALDAGDVFDQLVHGGLRDGGDLRVVTKNNATEGGRAAAVLAFTVELPSGGLAQVQTVVTVRNLMMVLVALRSRYGGVEGIE